MPFSCKACHLKIVEGAAGTHEVVLSHWAKTSEDVDQKVCGKAVQRPCKLLVIAFSHCGYLRL